MLETDELLDAISRLGFVPLDKNRNPTILLKGHNDQTYLGCGWGLMTWLHEALGQSLEHEE